MGENFLSMLDPLFSQEFPRHPSPMPYSKNLASKTGRDCIFPPSRWNSWRAPRDRRGKKKYGAGGFPEAFPKGSNVAHVHLALRCVCMCVCVTPRRALPHTLKHTFKIAHRGKTSTLFNSDFFFLPLALSLLHQTCLPVSV